MRFRLSNSPKFTYTVIDGKADFQTHACLIPEVKIWKYTFYHRTGMKEQEGEK